MALKVLMLRRKLTESQAQLQELRKAGDSFATREAELEVSITEATTEVEKSTVESEIEKFETEKAENAAALKKLEDDIRGIEAEIAKIEAEAPKAAATEKTEERKDEKPMNTRIKFYGMSTQERDAFFQRDDVKEFLLRVRELGKQGRSITNGDVLIPDVMLELVRENIESFSRLIGIVNRRSVPGTARQNIMGTIPEAVWTEMCAKLNELKIGFNQIEVDGYKVGGFMAICNALLEDSDIALGSEIIRAIGQAIGYAIDKAIPYGRGTKMPLGIITRLAQVAKPSGYPEKAPEWKDLTESNIIKWDSTSQKGADFFAQLIKMAAKTKSSYATGVKFWAMNEITYADIMAKLVTFNAAGAIVANMADTMPILGGRIVMLPFIPNGDILVGYGELYLLAERAGMQLAQSEQNRFIEDQTVFRGTARYDGTPVIPEAFVLMNINGNEPTTTITFAADLANA